MWLQSLAEVVALGLALQFPHFVNAQTSSDWKLSDSPPRDLFLRRAHARVAVLGNYAYIDGGEMSQLAADGKPIQNRGSNAVNSTLSIDLSQSWTASNVTIRIIEKPITGMDGQAMWKNEGLKTFFIWGGHIPYGGKIGPAESWKFEADGKGGGEWVTESPANPSLFSELRRNEDGAFVSTPDAGFWFGGLASAWTNPNAYVQAVPGVLSYNMTTKVWTNETTPGFSAFSKYGTMIGGGGVYIPTFGDNGLIVVMGGCLYTLEPSQKGPYGWMDFSNLTFYDPITKDWYWQQTTGNAPTPRRGFCSVGAEGKNGTYEIFVFGGTNTETGSTFDDVFVLSLPGFVWTQVQYQSKNLRRYHNCAVVGRRQMLSVGGTDGITGWSGADPWPNGLGIFDMTDLKWKSDYDTNAEDYETAKSIQDWYQNSGVNSVKWSSERVQKVFTKATSSNGSSEENPSSGTDKTPGANDNNNNLDGESQNRLSTAVIAGVVVGAVLGSIMVAAAFWFIRRRKQKSLAAATVRGEEPGVNPYYEPILPGELPSQPSRTELYGGPGSEDGSSSNGPKVEMMGSHGHHFTVAELDAHQYQDEERLRK
ncbi:kelch repeat protein [Colletotrichum truncatum]|uniref:Kelch repeat protein n=1 Tax=Colletotrichum truncatum TaxID=5467 RepID=A0ACC3YW08_COLTU|nr:kelch repeat protein [Colletotrichum truncatum]KAF6791143.1 kelch repeat protein [Colletotrichum truncatum]